MADVPAIADETPTLQEPPPLEEEAPTGPARPRDPNQLVIYKHWVKPTRVAYNYIYDYRHNYYDDVIDYLDRRQRGIYVETPRAQTWAERALRTYTHKFTSSATAGSLRSDINLLSNIRTSGRLHLHHNKDSFVRKYRV